MKLDNIFLLFCIFVAGVTTIATHNFSEVPSSPLVWVILVSGFCAAMILAKKYLPKIKVTRRNDFVGLLILLPPILLMLVVSWTKIGLSVSSVVLGIPLRIWILLLLGNFVIATWEEVIFRKKLLDYFGKKYGYFWATAISMTLFLAIHPDFHLSILITATLYYCVSILSGSIFIPILAHFLLDFGVTLVRIAKHWDECSTVCRNSAALLGSALSYGSSLGLILHCFYLLVARYFRRRRMNGSKGVISITAMEISEPEHTTKVLMPTQE